ncbi:MAG: hypothetical protein QOC94_983 [Actinoplanes sp.]|jgi:hypothetical protein|nr:hypothetical protein [Actinoplanes sp.]
MGEPERRRRRLRPPHTPDPQAPATTDPTPAAAPRLTPSAPATPTADLPDPVPPGPGSQAQTPPIADPVDEPATKPRAVGFAGRPRPVPADDREAERGLRGLVGSGSSQVSVGAALRARDAARPTEAHLAEAEQSLTIVRRNWTPREDLPRNR